MREVILAHATYDDQHIGRLNFDQFQAIAARLPPKAAVFFTATLFLKFERDEYGQINVNNFLNYIQRKSPRGQAGGRVGVAACEARAGHPNPHG